jgi:hypothetical protein
MDSLFDKRISQPHHSKSYGEKRSKSPASLHIRVTTGEKKCNKSPARACGQYNPDP